MSKILIIDDEAKITKLLSERIGNEGYNVSSFTSGEDALEEIRSGKVDIVLCDLRLGGMDGLELLRKTKKESPETDFVIMTAYASASTAVEAMREGAYEYLIKPFQMDEVVLLLKRIQERRELMIENVALREKVSKPSAGDRMIGASGVMKNIKEMISKVAPTDTPVLINGESGTGKELVAAHIHNSSVRKGKPFIVINCAAMPDTLLESELFGYERGAFTGASHKKPGQFKLADGGSLFLDEIGELPLALQAKLLRAIDNGEFLPLGGSSPVKVDVRIIAATNRDLGQMSQDGSFRPDLLFRLNVFPIFLPPLRERKEDIAAITADFLSGRNPGTPLPGKEVMEKLEGYSWPGNIRELKNILERAAILAGDEPISARHIMISDQPRSGSPEDMLGALVGEIPLPDLEKALISLAIRKSGGNKSKAAEMLGITRRTLYSRMEKHGLTGNLEE